MSSKDSRFWSLWWRFGGKAARRNLAAGDVAAAATAYTVTITAWLRAELAWKQWEMAAVYSDSELTAGAELGASNGRADHEFNFDLDTLEVPAWDPWALLVDMDEAFADLCAAHATLRSLDPAAPPPVRDPVHVEAAELR